MSFFVIFNDRFRETVDPNDYCLVKIIINWTFLLTFSLWSIDLGTTEHQGFVFSNTPRGSSLSSKGTCRYRTYRTRGSVLFLKLADHPLEMWCLFFCGKQFVFWGKHIFSKCLQLLRCSNNFRTVYPHHKKAWIVNESTS